ncbi:hypothetical protein NPIL_592011 [Nephila pilipes]|uniref:Uncharacterized protein n=1 Tax=Nephila pilipes TaxID=299642 RepID=A0A8X6PJX6_NEPPI|nr:hypothetical protein NPIL_592011 [Nephila pilipes]
MSPAALQFPHPVKNVVCAKAPTCAHKKSKGGDTGVSPCHRIIPLPKLKRGYKSHHYLFIYRVEKGPHPNRRHALSLRPHHKTVLLKLLFGWR